MRLSGADLRLLRVFDVVVRSQGLAAAQSELNVSLSTISAQITALELRFGFRLCDRGRSGFRLTERGRRASDSIRSLLSTLNDFTDEIADLRHDFVGKLRIGVMDCLSSDPTAKLDLAISNYTMRAPKVRLALIQGSRRDLQMQILNGELDVAFGSFDGRPRGVETVSLHAETSSLFCGEGHALFQAQANCIDERAVLAYPLVARSRAHSGEVDLAPFSNVLAETQTIEQQLLLVQSGAYLGFLPDHFAAPFVSAGRLWPVMPRKFRFVRHYEAIFRSDADASERVTTFVDVLRGARGGPDQHLAASDEPTGEPCAVPKADAVIVR